MGVKKISMIGSGNFACAMVRNVARNATGNPDLFDPVVQMWVFEEQVPDKNGNISIVIPEDIIFSINLSTEYINLL